VFHQTTDTAVTLVISCIDYCNAVLAGVCGAHLQQLNEFLTLQLGLITRKRKFDSILPTLLDLSALAADSTAY